MKTIYIVGFSLILFIVILLFIMFSGGKNSVKINLPFFPIPTPITSLQESSNGITKISTTQPNDRANNIPADTTITLILTKPIDPNKPLDIWIYPEISYTTSVQGSRIAIKPSSPLLPGTNYEYAIRYADGTISPTYNFSTQGTNPTPGVQDTFGREDDSWEKHFMPDLFLANSTPYSAQDFSVTSSPSDASPSHIIFSVLLLGNPDASKQEFLSWVISTGVLLSQVNQLDIHYQIYQPEH